MGQFDVENWREQSKSKEIIPADLEKIITPGSRIFFGSGCSEPIFLTDELAKDTYRFNDCQILHFFSLSEREFFDELKPTSFRHNTLSIVGSTKLRKAINLGHSDFTPISSSEIPRLLRGKRQRIYIDVALLQVTPPDNNGYCSLGINVDINKTMVDMARIVIVQINPQMPRTMGNSFIQFEEIDYYCYQDMLLLEYDPYRLGSGIESTEQSSSLDTISKYIAQLIENGSTLNIGIGKICYKLPQYLAQKKDLAIYSEVLQESLMPLIQNDVITCKQNYFPHIMTSLAIGSQRFYQFLANHPFIEFHPTEYLVNIPRIARNHKMCSIYSAMKVDLLGQATNDLKSTVFEGTGGESDFMTGSNLSDRGKCIVALPSTTKSGKSRILPLLNYEPVSLRAIDVHYIITEYGIAYLRGKSIRERILQMIGIAHPKFRQELLDQAKKMNKVYQDQQIPTTKDGVVVIYPNNFWNYTPSENLTIHFRAVQPTDEREVQDLYYNLSPEDRVSRFFTFMRKFDHKLTQSRVVCDYQNSYVIVGIVGNIEEKNIIAIGEYYLREHTSLVEIAITVDKEYRKFGIGRHITMKLIEIAQEKGFTGICGDVLMTNQVMIRILKSLPYNTIFRGDGASMEFQTRFSDSNLQK
ncbi:MAG: GNAT family N-acetyltransferase [Promethearchaeota archaeon]|nr:MAG: GNAT family N-acetyltransferase [Candidatus Lokiarchaeota archaeon]